MKDWLWFSGAIRTSVRGSGIVADILEAVLDGHRDQASVILANEGKTFDRLEEFLEECDKLMRTGIGRKQLKTLAIQHRAESRFAIDDLSLRRAYVSVLNGEFVESLPEIGLKGRG